MTSGSQLQVPSTTTQSPRRGETQVRQTQRPQQQHVWTVSLFCYFWHSSFEHFQRGGEKETP